MVNTAMRGTGVVAALTRRVDHEPAQLIRSFARPRPGTQDQAPRRGHHGPDCGVPPALYTGSREKSRLGSRPHTTAPGPKGPQRGEGREANGTAKGKGLNRKDGKGGGQQPGAGPGVRAPDPADSPSSRAPPSTISRNRRCIDVPQPAAYIGFRPRVSAESAFVVAATFSVPMPTPHRAINVSLPEHDRHSGPERLMTC